MGKSKPKGRKIEAHSMLDRHKYVEPRELLIGYSGKVVHKKLKPLRRSRSDKLRDAAILEEYEERCNHLERLAVSHKNLLERIHEVVEEGHGGADFLQELHHIHADNVKHIRFLLRTDDVLAALPQELFDKLFEVAKKDKALRDVKLLLQNLKKSSAHPGRVEVEGKSQRTKNNYGGRLQSRNKQTSQEKIYQLFVHGVDEKAPLVVKLKGNDTGSVLERAINEKSKKCPTYYSLIYHGKKIMPECTLNEQGLENDSNIHVHFALRGGMEQDDAHPSSSTADTQGNPVKWKKAQVAAWIDQMCEECDLDKEGVVRLKDLSGRAINSLKRRDWIERSPEVGDVLYNLWVDIATATQTGETSEKKNMHVTESRPMNTSKPEVKDVSKEWDVCTVVEEQESQVVSEASSADRTIKGPFGEVKKLDDVDSFTSIDDISKSPPQFGAIVSVTGLCSSRPRVAGGAGTVLLRNDPPLGETFLELKVDVRVCPDSRLLTKHNLSTALDQELGRPLYIRGRVEHLDKDFVSMKKGFKVFPFKLVVDSDTHAVAREEVKVERPFARQFSTPWHVQMGIFPAEGSSHEPLFQQDILTKTPGVLWCQSDDTEKILEMVVALKNSMPGDIYIGVKDSGYLKGISLSKDEVNKKREKLIKEIGGIFPSVNDRVAVCTSASNAQELVDKKKTFVAAMWLPIQEANLEQLDEDEVFSTLFRIHVVKGSHPLHLLKPKHSHAYTRVGTETKLMNDYEELSSRLESLASRKLPEKKASDIEQEVEKASTYEKTEATYNLFQRLRFETDKREFKVIHGDPKTIILKKYVNEYTASFLNTDGGDIYFGVEEDENSKVGQVVGVVLSQDDRKKLLKESSKLICNFWPPVDSTQFLMKFVDVKSDSSKNLLTYPNTHHDHQGECVVVRVKSPGQIGKFDHLVKRITSPASLLGLGNNVFCILVDDVSRENREEIVFELNKESKKSDTFALEGQPKKKVEDLLKSLCVVDLRVNASQYPLHLTSFLRSFCLDGEGKVSEMTPQQLLERFSQRDTHFDTDKFLQTVNEFDNSSTSYVMVASPFLLSKTKRDLYGLVVPDWSLVLDFDQNPNGEGHLLDAFRPKHDLHQVERNLVVKTPLDRKLSLNPSNGMCWCAVRGYQDVNDTLSEEGHAKWMTTHGHNVKKLVLNLVHQIQPNQLVVQVLWNDHHEDLLSSLKFVLETILSLYGPVKVVFVCSNKHAELTIVQTVVDPLQKDGYVIRKDNIFVSLPNHLALDLGAKLPAPYRPENAFQIPKKLYFPDGDSRTIPDTLQQNLRQAVKGHLEIMYLNQGAQGKPEDVDKAREEFYAGSEITPIGLSNRIGIERDVMKKLKNEMKSMLSDRKSHVSIIILKAERGAGATTLGMQLLYEYHRLYVCARLLELHEHLVANIEKIAHTSNLPVILFVDSEMANLSEFVDFKNEAEKRSAKLLLLVVESAVNISKSPRSKVEPNAPFMFYSTGMAPQKTVELNRELTSEEVSCLVQQLVKIKDISDDKRERLRRLEERAKNEGTFRKFAFFSLTLFGKKFAGLPNYVEIRLEQADEAQIQVLEFLSLTHFYTGCQFPVNAFARFLDTEQVILECVFNNADVRELLSPPCPGKNVRRISFLEVAEEILHQLGKKHGMKCVDYLKDVAVRLAKKALSVSHPSKSVDRITRRLYVTSDFEGEKFSSLVRCMKDLDEGVACDMLKDLCKIFEQGRSSLWAHLLAHLAKYYMRMDTPNFEEAIPLITEASREHRNDVLLHHIHGDIIRLHIKNLKDKKKFNMEEILKFAIRSSECFDIVRKKRPLMEGGYTSDAVVRKDVMLAAIKSVGVRDYVDYLDDFLQEIAPKSQMPLRYTEKFVLCLLPDAFSFLRQMPINEHIAFLKDKVLNNMGECERLKVFCEKLKTVMKGTCNEGWVDEVVLRTTTLIYALELEKKQLTPEEADQRIQNLEELLTCSDHDDESMKLWIRCARLGSKIPNLKTVRKNITKWLNATRRKSVNALFYHYVVAILEAVSDECDKEKMTTACESIAEMRRKRYSKEKQVSNDPALPVEWLHPKQGHHINSIDCLLYHEDLVQNYIIRDTRSMGLPSRGAGREIIEKALFEKNICKWEGIVSEVLSDWKGTITFKRFIPVPFVPNNVQQGMPHEGERVRFCIAFHWSGPRAYYVISEPGVEKSRKAVSRSFPQPPMAESDNDDEDEDNDDHSEDEEDKEGLEPMVKPLHRRDVKPRQIFEQQKNVDWYMGQKEQGLVLRTNPDLGYGFIGHPDVEEELFFHAQQMVPPVESLKVTKNLQTVVSFTVGKARKGPRAVNIQIVEEVSIVPKIREYRERCQANDKGAQAYEPESPETIPWINTLGGRHEGVIIDIRTDGQSKYGYIKSSSLEHPILFHQESWGMSQKEARKVKEGAKVQFTIEYDFIKRIDVAKDLFVRCVETKKICECGWEKFVDNEQVKEGFVFLLRHNFGFISERYPASTNRGLYFHDSELRNCTFDMLKPGSKVQFKVRKTEKSCIATEIKIVSQLQRQTQGIHLLAGAGAGADHFLPKWLQ